MREGAGLQMTKYISDKMLIGIFDLLAMVHILSDGRKSNNYKNNKDIWKSSSAVYTEGRYIEHQGAMRDLKYGYKNVAYSGCEVIAVYNAEVTLAGGNEPDKVTFVDLLKKFEDNGIVLGGLFGTAPNAMNDYLKNRGYTTEMLVGDHITEASLERFGKYYDVFIVTLYNNRENVSDQIHTMCISEVHSKTGTKQYVMHNAGDTVIKDDSIQGVLNDYNRGISEPICIIGIAK